MICKSCRTHLLSRLHFQPQTLALPTSTCARQLPFHSGQFRKYSDTTPPPAPRQPASSDKPITIPSATSSATPGVSQPLSTSNAVHSDVDPTKPTKPAVVREPSSCPAGTKLQGLNYFKNKPDVFALEDSEYPDWLWGLLDNSNKQSKAETGGVDPSTMNKKQRKRHEKKMAALAASQPRKIPLHEQAVDITPAPYNADETGPKDIVAEAAASLEKRNEITKSAREARRKGIREANFLRGL
ncbi:hypothetical protein VTN00DRAFT_6977 [Thermoascus crustaceus]|uniref:mitochondrial 54S ribosomal protein mL54 n=1 Tax=Thermoascus crustaceus TaxID=5088 RepID=UPI00374319AC